MGHMAAIAVFLSFQSLKGQECVNQGPSLRHLEWPWQAKPPLKPDRRGGEAAGMEPRKDSDKAALHSLNIQ